jgi:RecB family endonuclease NucS
MILKKGMRVRYRYVEVQRYRHWVVMGIGCIVAINDRRSCPITVQERDSDRVIFVKRNEIVKVLKDNKLRPYEHPDFVHCGYQLCCY